MSNHPVNVTTNGNETIYRWRAPSELGSSLVTSLVVLSICLLFLAGAGQQVYRFNATGQMPPISNTLLCMPLAALAAVGAWRYGLKVLDCRACLSEMRLVDRQLTLRISPKSQPRTFDTGNWSQLYVTTSGELRKVDDQGKHEVLASGRLVDMQFIERDLEQKLQIVNVSVDGEAWQMSPSGTVSEIDPRIRRVESDGRLQLTVATRELSDPSYLPPSYWLILHCVPTLITGDPSHLAMLLWPTAWFGYIALYFAWAEKGNQTKFYLDDQVFRYEQGSRPTFFRPWSVSTGEIQDIRYVERQVRVNDRSRKRHLLEVLYGNQQLKTLYCNDQAGDLYLALQSEFRNHLQSLSDKHPQFLKSFQAETIKRRA